MSNNNQNQNKLVNISESGTYRLKLCLLKSDKITIDPEDGTLIARLFFLDENGLCLSKKYKTKYPIALAILVGKLTNVFMKPIEDTKDPEKLLEYLAPAFNKWADYDITVGSNEYNGKNYFNYKFNSIKSVALLKSEENKSEQEPEAPPF